MDDNISKFKEEVLRAAKNKALKIFKQGWEKPFAYTTDYRKLNAHVKKIYGSSTEEILRLGDNRLKDWGFSFFCLKLKRRQGYYPFGAVWFEGIGWLLPTTADASWMLKQWLCDNLGLVESAKKYFKPGKGAGGSIEIFHGKGSKPPEETKKGSGLLSRLFSRVTWYCRNCGAEIAPEASFCPKCKKELAKKGF